MKDSLSLGQTSRASKFQKTDEDFCEDWFSDLPQIAINHILSFIPMKDAARTKVLSKQWRYVLSSLPNLEFNEYWYDNGNNDIKKVCFIQFVDQIILTRDCSNVRKLQILCCELSTVSHIHEWVSYATTRYVQYLCVWMGRFTLDTVQRKVLPDHLFTSMSLRKLELCLPGHLLKLPKKIHFPTLESLMLLHMNLFDDDLTTQLFSSSPILKTLSICDCDVSRLKTLFICHPQLEELYIDTLNGSSNCELKIVAPALEILFCYDDSLQMCTIERIPSLLEVTFELKWEVFGCRAAQIFKAIDSTKRLTLCGCYAKSPKTMSNLSACLPTLWPRLDYLYIAIDCKYLQVMASYLKTCPSLTLLDLFMIDQPTNSNKINTEGYWDLKELCLSIKMLNHLEEVSIFILDESDSYMNSIKIFIENATNLKRMKLKFDYFHSSEEWMEIFQKLRSFTKASPHVINVVVNASCDNSGIILE